MGVVYLASKHTTYCLLESGTLGNTIGIVLWARGVSASSQSIYKQPQLSLTYSISLPFVFCKPSLYYPILNKFICLLVRLVVLVISPVDRANSFVGTAQYVSPELLQDKVAFKRCSICYSCMLVSV